MKGQINEYVVCTPIADTQYIESRLDWDVDFIKFMGASVDVVLFKHIYLGISGRFGFTGESGVMQDYDWLNVDPSTFKKRNKEWYDSHYWLTNYSRHENILTKYLDGSLKVGGIIELPFKFFLMPSFSLQGQDFAFDGMNGYCQYVWATPNYKNPDGSYKEWSEDIPKNSDGFSGKVISYNQQRLFLFLGLKAYTTIIPRFRLEIEGKYSPFTSIGALDNHWIKYMDYLDQPKGLGTWTVAGQIQFSFNKLCKLALNCDYQYVPFLVGDNYCKSARSDTWHIETEYLGGASSTLFSFSLMATLFF